MSSFEDLTRWLSDHPVYADIFKYLAWVLLTFTLASWVRRWLKKRIADNAVKYKAQKGVEILGYIIVLFISISFFPEASKTLALPLACSPQE